MFKKLLTAIFILLWILLAINPVDPGIWALENVLVVTLFPLVLWLDKRYCFSNWAYLGLTVFVALHLFGAHLTYNNMTYFSWFSDWFGLKRNYYDHLIHLLFGLLVAVPFFEIFFHQGISKKVSYLLSLLFITAIGAWYEILEWIVVLLFCRLPNEACIEAITQGDTWDAQKDIAYAVVGSVISLTLHGFLHRKTARKEG